MAEIAARFGESGLIDFDQLDGTVHVSDDTQLTLYTVDGLLEALEWANDGVQADTKACLWLAYLRWLDTQGERPPSSAPTPQRRWIDSHAVLRHRRHPGTACLTGLASGEMGTASSPVNPGARGCGTVMRSAPFGLLPHTDPENVYNLAIAGSALTHGDPVAHHSAAVFALLIRALVHDDAGLAAAARAAAQRASATGVDVLAERVRAAVALAEQPDVASPEALTATLGLGWVAEEALAIGLYAALSAQRQVKDPTEQFRTALKIAVNHDGDSDSTGSIAGNIVGATYGNAVLPSGWVDRLDACEVIAEAAQRLVDSTGLQ